MGKRVRRSEDRISKLPPELRHQILYYLTTKEAAATSVLSSLWKDVWLTLPWLRLNEEFFQHILHNHPHLSYSHQHIFTFIDHHIFKRRRDHNNKIMLEQLLLHIPRLNFVSGYYFPEPTISLLNRLLVQVVTEFQVKKIDLSLGFPLDYYRLFPQNSFISSTTLASWKQLAQVSELNLTGCKLNSCLETKWSSLRILYLKRVNLLHQQLLDSVIAHCHLIKSLSIVDCVGDFDTLNVLCLKRLVTLFIFDPFNYFKMIQVDAPNLESLSTIHSYGHYVLKKFEFEYKKDDKYNTLEMCGYCESLPVKCWRHCLDKVTIINSRMEKSPINLIKDAQLKEFFKAATYPRIIVVKIIYM